jgi:hypothetical protein
MSRAVAAWNSDRDVEDLEPFYVEDRRRRGGRRRSRNRCRVLHRTSFGRRSAPTFTTWRAALSAAEGGKRSGSGPCARRDGPGS